MCVSLNTRRWPNSVSYSWITGKIHPTQKVWEQNTSVRQLIPYSPQLEQNKLGQVLRGVAKGILGNVGNNCIQAVIEAYIPKHGWEFLKGAWKTWNFELLHDTSASNQWWQANDTTKSSRTTTKWTLRWDCFVNSKCAYNGKDEGKWSEFGYKLNSSLLELDKLVKLFKTCTIVWLLVFVFPNLSNSFSEQNVIVADGQSSKNKSQVVGNYPLMSSRFQMCERSIASFI